jgi:hypothetical protein
MDKGEYKKVLDAVKAHTRKDLEFLGDAKEKSKKEKLDGPAGRMPQQNDVGPDMISKTISNVRLGELMWEAVFN